VSPKKKIKSPPSADIESRSISSSDEINTKPLSSTKVSSDRPKEEVFMYEDQLNDLMVLGFDKDDAKQLLIALEGNVELAANMLPLVLFHTT